MKHISQSAISDSGKVTKGYRVIECDIYFLINVGCVICIDGLYVNSHLSLPVNLETEEVARAFISEATLGCCFTLNESSTM